MILISSLGTFKFCFYLISKIYVIYCNLIEIFRGYFDIFDMHFGDTWLSLVIRFMFFYCHKSAFYHIGFAFHHMFLITQVFGAGFWSRVCVAACEEE